MKKIILIAIALMFSILLINTFRADETSDVNSYNNSNKSDNYNSKVNSLREQACADFVEFKSAKVIAEEYGQTEMWILNNHKINVWSKQSSEGKEAKVGEMRPGSRGLLIEEGINDYKIESPLDKSIGWVSKIQAKGLTRKNPKTFEECINE